MAHAQHPRLLSHDWLELHPRLKTEFFKHVVALSIAGFVLMVAVLLGLFEWAQILPEQIAVGVDASPHRTFSPATPAYATEISRNDPFAEQKKAAATTELPEQF